MDKDTDLERLRTWLATYPGYDILHNMLVDYINEIPGAASLMPAGLTEISRTEDILGNVTVRNQYNFGLYLALEKSPGDDIASAYNAGWVLRASPAPPPPSATSMCAGRPSRPRTARCWTPARRAWRCMWCSFRLNFLHFTR